MDGRVCPCRDVAELGLNKEFHYKAFPGGPSADLNIKGGRESTEAQSVVVELGEAS